MMREGRYYVYTMASKSRVIYVGVTAFLMVLVLRHKAGVGGALLPSIACIGWFTFTASRMWGDAMRGRRRLRDGGGRRK